MALPVTMYRWDDVGAPQIVDGKPSEYMNVLKKCLVEGYGSKASLGWSVAEEIAVPPYIAFKNDVTAGGSGGVITFSADNDLQGTVVKYESCQDYIDKTNQMRKSAYAGFDRYIDSDLYRLNKWFVIGTSKAFYLFIFSQYHLDNGNYQGTRESISFFSGDFESLYPNDDATFITVSGQRNNLNPGWNQNFLYVLSESQSVNLLDLYALDGSDSSGIASLSSIFGDYFWVSSTFDATANINVLSPVYLLMGFSGLKTSDSYQNTSLPFYRGVFPGLFIADAPGHRQEKIPFTRTLDNLNYFSVPSGNSHTSCCWISLEEW